MSRDVHAVARGDVLEHGLEHVRSQEKGVGHLARREDPARADEVQDILELVSQVADAGEIEKLRGALDGVGCPEDPVDDFRVHVFPVRFDLDEVFLDVRDVLSRFGHEFFDEIVKVTHVRLLS